MESDERWEINFTIQEKFDNFLHFSEDFLTSVWLLHYCLGFSAEYIFLITARTAALEYSEIVVLIVVLH